MEVLYGDRGSTNATAICIDGEPELLPVLLRSLPGVSKKKEEETEEGGGDPFFAKKAAAQPRRRKLKWLSNCGVLDQDPEGNPMGGEPEGPGSAGSGAAGGAPKRGFGAAWG